MLHLVLIAFKHSARIALKEADGLAIAPTAVLFRQPVRHLIVRQSNQRLDTVPGHFIKQPIVKRQPGLVGGFLIALRENARPGNGGAQALEAHLREQRDILRVTVVKVDRHVLDAAVAINPWRHRAENALRLQIGSRQPFTVGLISPFHLICRNCAAPQKMVWKFAAHRFLLG
ncbi:hypothetical protein D3C80_1571150 [compost metagenome]